MLHIKIYVSLHNTAIDTYEQKSKTMEPEYSTTAVYNTKI